MATVAEHTLQTPWTFYYYSKHGGKTTTSDYAKCIQKIAQVATVEQFWAVYTHIISPSNLKIGVALHFFRQNARAMWEDDINKNGGTYQVKLPRGHATKAWELLCLDLIGENLNNDIVGAVIKLRQDSDLLTVWARTSEDLNLRQQIVDELIKSIQLPAKSIIEFLPHTKVSPTGQPINPSKYVFESDGPVLINK